MAHQRGASTIEGIKEPHSVSLKVLRLSRPSLSIQHPLPTPSPSPVTVYPAAAASLSYPSSESDNFILSALLTLPPAFGSAYVGETFSCTLCANNELSSPKPAKTTTNVRIEAEMKIPSSTTPITLSLLPNPHSNDSDNDEDTPVEPEPGIDLQPGESLQKIISFDLKEEGSHVLAVTVTYTESTPTSGRIRTFRKLYQFVCKGCMVVRTKTGLLPPSSSSQGRKWALEAQLENTGEEIITLETVALETREGIRSFGCNWREVDGQRPVMSPGDVQQVAFVVEETGKRVEEIDGKVAFGILKMEWRGPMGNRGVLSTGILGAKVG